MELIKVAVCDDLIQICEFVEYMCGKYERLNFEFAAATAAECLQQLETHTVDVLLLDIQLETETGGIDMIPKVLEIQPACKIIMLTSHMNDEYIFNAFSSGATDYVSKTESAEMIAQKIESVYSNMSSLKPEIAQQLVKRGQKIQRKQVSILYYINVISHLTVSELEVLKAIYFGASYSQIAKQRYVTVGTIKTLSSRVLKKMGASSMKELLKELEHLQIFEEMDL